MAIHNFTFSPACAEHERAALRRLDYRLIWRNGLYILYILRTASFRAEFTTTTARISGDIGSAREAFGSAGVQLVQYHTREVRL